MTHRTGMGLGPILVACGLQYNLVAILLITIIIFLVRKVFLAKYGKIKKGRHFDITH